ncbi:hypothetical protein BGZ94_004716, partial [Podila epigama]
MEVSSSKRGLEDDMFNEFDDDGDGTGMDLLPHKPSAEGYRDNEAQPFLKNQKSEMSL